MKDKPKNYTVGMVIVDYDVRVIREAFKDYIAKAKGHKKDTAEDLLGMIEGQVAKQKLNAKSIT